jgi:exonuclease III
MEKILRALSIIFFVISCSGGGESSPTDPGDGVGGNNTNPYEFPNAVNYNISNQVEVVTWNVKNFPQHSTSDDYVKALLEKWNADIYLLQEINDANGKPAIKSMVNSMPNYSYVLDEESENLGFALIYRNDYITYLSKNELWHETSSNPSDCNGDYLNCKLYMFAGRAPMESYLTWTDGTKTMNLYTINIHYKARGDGVLKPNNLTHEATRRHNSSLLLTDYLLNNRANDNVILVGDFNNIGTQNITNPALSPFTDKDNFDSAASFKLTDLNVLLGPKSGWSWQGWDSSYDEAHFDHIVINQPLFSYDATSSIEVINLPNQVGISTSNLSSIVSDHQPLIYRFYP